MLLRNSSNKKFLFLVLLIAFFCIAILSSTLGAANISFKEALFIMVKNIPVVGDFITGDVQTTHNIIITKIRFPRIIAASLIGMGLSVVGTAFQAMFRNPMADPYVLGVSTGAALGGAIAIVFAFSESFLGFGAVTVFAFSGALITTFLVYNIARIGNKIPTTTLLLSGVSLSFFMSSIISVLMVLNREAVEKIVFWTMGSLTTSNWKQNIILVIIIGIGVLIIYFYNGDLNIMLTGDEDAISLGVDVETVKKRVLIVSSLIVGAAVSFCGVIGFVGLIVPHAMRIMIGSNHKYLVPFSAVGGALFMVIADTLARILAAPSELPVGAITALFGAPYFTYLLVKNKKKVA